MIMAKMINYDEINVDGNDDPHYLADYGTTRGHQNGEGSSLDSIGSSLTSLTDFLPSL